jgi:V-type H+-transporting ATPase subunit A
MLRNIIAFYSLATAAVERTAGGGSSKVTFNQIKAELGNLMYKVSSQKFQDPAEGEQNLRKFFSDLHEEITDSFANLTD